MKSINLYKKSKFTIPAWIYKTKKWCIISFFLAFFPS